jgi:hypothetical protein
LQRISDLGNATKLQIFKQKKTLKIMLTRNKIKRGDKITYKQEFMFGKGIEMITAIVVAISGKYALLDNGNQILIF